MSIDERIRRAERDGDWEAVAQLRQRASGYTMPKPFPQEWLRSNRGYGDGYGYGYGKGYGDGNGYGNGYGDGYGDGNGSGSGYGNGDGHGDGYGYGYGYGYGNRPQGGFL